MSSLRHGGQGMVGNVRNMTSPLLSTALHCSSALLQVSGHLLEWVLWSKPSSDSLTRWQTDGHLWVCTWNHSRLEKQLKTLTCFQCDLSKHLPFHQSQNFSRWIYCICGYNMYIQYILYSTNYVHMVNMLVYNFICMYI